VTKRWYHFDGVEVHVRVSVYAVDERAARGCLRIMFKTYKNEDWTLHSATHNRNGAGIISRTLSHVF